MVAEEDSKAPPKCRNCAGLLYFSSLRKSQARNPLCFGLSRAERNAKRYTGAKFKSDPRALLDFKYACVGYSIHDDAKASSSTTNADKHLDLPFCMGIEVLAERTGSQGGHHRHVNNKEDHEKKEVTPITKRPPSAIRNSSSTGTIGPEEFSARFVRNAGLVAGAVVKNLSKVGNSIKTAAMDIFQSDRGKSK